MALGSFAKLLQQYEVELRYDPLHNFADDCAAFFRSNPPYVLGVAFHDYIKFRPGPTCFHEFVHLMTHMVRPLREKVHYHAHFQPRQDDPCNNGNRGTFDELAAHSLTVNYLFQNRYERRIVPSKPHFAREAIDSLISLRETGQLARQAVLDSREELEWLCNQLRVGNLQIRRRFEQDPAELHFEPANMRLVDRWIGFSLHRRPQRTGTLTVSPERGVRVRYVMPSSLLLPLERLVEENPPPRVLVTRDAFRRTLAEIERQNAIILEVVSRFSEVVRPLEEVMEFIENCGRTVSPERLASTYPHLAKGLASVCRCANNIFPDYIRAITKRWPKDVHLHSNERVQRVLFGDFF